MDMALKAVPMNKFIRMTENMEKSFLGLRGFVWVVFICF